MSGALELPQRGVALEGACEVLGSLRIELVASQAAKEAHENTSTLARKRALVSAATDIF